MTDPISLEWFKNNAPGFSGDLAWQEPLARHTYYRIGGPAGLLAQPKNLADLAWLSRGLQESQAPFWILGAGSNVLVSDQGFAGVVIKCSKLNPMIEPLPVGELTSELWIRTGAGVAISSLLRRASAEGWAGLELWTGIPGTVGGAVVMNAGTHLGETQQIIESVKLFSLRLGQERTLTKEELSFDYRKNFFVAPDEVVTEAVWRLKQADPTQVGERIREILARRKATQPIDYPSCGSVFKNPKASGLHAWQVIEKVGLRGHRIGNAEFSAKHCNFIVNLGGARASDVQALIGEAKKRARESLGIELEEEVRLLGSTH